MEGSTLGGALASFVLPLAFLEGLAAEGGSEVEGGGGGRLEGRWVGLEVPDMRVISSLASRALSRRPALS